MRVTPDFRLADGSIWWVAESTDPALAREAARLALGSEPRLRGPAGCKQTLCLLGPEGRRLLLKRWVERPLRGLRPGSKALRELRIGTGLRRAGVPAAEALTAGERRWRGLRQSWLLQPIVPGARDLQRTLSEALPVPDQRRRLARALGRLARRAHDAGLWMHDFTPSNVLVTGQAAEPLWLVDFERARRGPRPGARARAWMLAKLERALGDGSRADRLRMLRAYDAPAARDWWHRVEGAAAGLAARDARRLRAAARGGGRRFRVVQLGAGRAVLGAHAGPDQLQLPAPGVETPARLPLASGARWLIRYPECSRAAARGLLARASLLADRGLAPRPIGTRREGSEAWLVLERGPESVALGGSPGAARRLFERLLGIGDLQPPETLAAVELVRRQGRSQARLLLPHLFEPRRGGAGPVSRRRARAWLDTALPHSVAAGGYR